jgi:proline racemase
VIEVDRDDAFASGYAVSDVWGVGAAMLDRDG